MACDGGQDQRTLVEVVYDLLRRIDWKRDTGCRWNDQGGARRHQRLKVRSDGRA